MDKSTCTGRVMLRNCGKASRQTQGLPFQILWENGFAPFNTIWIM
jgi:hypothetical protein